MLRLFLFRDSRSRRPEPTRSDRLRRGGREIPQQPLKQLGHVPGVLKRSDGAGGGEPARLRVSQKGEQMVKITVDVEQPDRRSELFQVAQRQRFKQLMIVHHFVTHPFLYSMVLLYLCSKFSIKPYKCNITHAEFVLVSFRFNENRFILRI